MTRLQILNSVKRRLNKSTTATDSDARLLEFINEVHRAVLSESGMETLRRTTPATFPSVDGTPNYTISTIARVNRVWETTNDRRLEEISLDRYRSIDVDPTNNKGTPYAYAWATTGVSSVTLFLTPCPSAAISYSVDGLSVISDLSADGTEPNLPLDFHDILVYGALSREYEHLDDKRLHVAETRYAERLRTLKHWLAETDTGTHSGQSERSMFNGSYYPGTRW
jgi:hypothetical protein